MVCMSNRRSSVPNFDSKSAAVSRPSTTISVTGVLLDPHQDVSRPPTSVTGVLLDPHQHISRPPACSSCSQNTFSTKSWKFYCTWMNTGLDLCYMLHVIVKSYILYHAHFRRMRRRIEKRGGCRAVSPCDTPRDMFTIRRTLLLLEGERSIHGERPGTVSARGR